MEKKNHLFKAEIKEMLDLVVNSLYSKKEIFLRELVSNASDAIDRAKYLGLTQKELVADNPTWRIDIMADKATIIAGSYRRDAGTTLRSYVMGGAYSNVRNYFTKWRLILREVVFSNSVSRSSRPLIFLKEGIFLLSSTILS